MLYVLCIAIEPNKRTFNFHIESHCVCAMLISKTGIWSERNVALSYSLFFNRTLGLFVFSFLMQNRGHSNSRQIWSFPWSLINRIFFFEQELHLSESSTSFQIWKDTPVPMYIQFYFFNWTNPDDIEDKSTKPSFVQMGPYRFKWVLFIHCTSRLLANHAKLVFYF